LKKETLVFLIPSMITVLGKGGEGTEGLTLSFGWLFSKPSISNGLIYTTHCLHS